MVYKWKDTIRFKADVEKVGKELEQIDRRDPKSVVFFAEDEKSELHKCFTWDDHKAAHYWRLEEARTVIQSIIVVDDAPDREPIEYRAFESVIVDGSRQYMPTKTIMADKNMKSQVLGEIGSSIDELSKKAKVYRYLAKNELDSAQKHLDLAREAVTV
jgi:hypothetical protein